MCPLGLCLLRLILLGRSSCGRGSLGLLFCFRLRLLRFLRFLLGLLLRLALVLLLLFSSSSHCRLALLMLLLAKLRLFLFRCSSCCGRGSGMRLGIYLVILIIQLLRPQLHRRLIQRHGIELAVRSLNDLAQFLFLIHKLQTHIRIIRRFLLELCALLLYLLLYRLYLTLFLHHYIQRIIIMFSHTLDQFDTHEHIVKIRRIYQHVLIGINAACHVHGLDTCHEIRAQRIYLLDLLLVFIASLTQSCIEIDHHSLILSHLLFNVAYLRLYSCILSFQRLYIILLLFDLRLRISYLLIEHILLGTQVTELLIVISRFFLSADLYVAVTAE